MYSICIIVLALIGYSMVLQHLATSSNENAEELHGILHGMWALEGSVVPCRVSSLCGGMYYWDSHMNVHCTIWQNCCLRTSSSRFCYPHTYRVCFLPSLRSAPGERKRSGSWICQSFMTFAFKWWSIGASQVCTAGKAQNRSDLHSQIRDSVWPYITHQWYRQAVFVLLL